MDLYPLALSFLAASSLTMEMDTVYQCCLSFSLCPIHFPELQYSGHGPLAMA